MDRGAWRTTVHGVAEAAMTDKPQHSIANEDGNCWSQRSGEQILSINSSSDCLNSMFFLLLFFFHQGLMAEQVATRHIPIFFCKCLLSRVEASMNVRILYASICVPLMGVLICFSSV